MQFKVCDGQLGVYLGGCHSFAKRKALAAPTHKDNGYPQTPNLMLYYSSNKAIMFLGSNKMGARGSGALTNIAVRTLPCSLQTKIYAQAAYTYFQPYQNIKQRSAV